MCETLNVLEAASAVGKQIDVLHDCSTQCDGCSSTSDEQDASGSDCAPAQAAGFALIDAAVRSHSTQLGKVSELLVGCLSEHLDQVKVVGSTGKKPKAHKRATIDLGQGAEHRCGPCLAWENAVRSSAVPHALGRWMSSRTSLRQSCFALATTT